MTTAYRPGTQVSLQAIQTPRANPSSSGTWFVVGQTDAGPLTPVAVNSLAQFVSIFGSRQSWNATFYDALDTFFNEGGNTAVVTRVVGPSAVTAFKNLLDAGAGVSLVVSAKGPGAGSDTTHGNSLKVQVLAGVVSGFRIQILDSGSNVLELSSDLTTQQDAINWSLYSAYVNITIGATALVPAVAAAASLATGTDDRTNIVTASYTTSLNAMGQNLGMGQVSIPGVTADAVHVVLMAHANANNRKALVDLPDTPTSATLQASAVAARTSNGDGAAFTPWLQAPGLVQGTTRVVPPSAFIAGLLARNDALLLNQNIPAAGDLGQAQWVVGLSQTIFDNDDAGRQTLANASVNLIRTVNGGIRNYGFRSLVDPVAAPTWLNFANCRLAMAIQDKAKFIEEQNVFAQLDGQGVEVGHFNGQLVGMLTEFWKRGALYGVNQQDAFFVDTGPTVNTLLSLSNNELHATINVKMAPMAEFVQVAVVKVPITGLV